MLVQILSQGALAQGEQEGRQRPPRAQMGPGPELRPRCFPTAVASCSLPMLEMGNRFQQGKVSHSHLSRPQEHVHLHTASREARSCGLMEFFRGGTWFQETFSQGEELA